MSLIFCVCHIIESDHRVKAVWRMWRNESVKMCSACKPIQSPHVKCTSNLWPSCSRIRAEAREKVFLPRTIILIFDTVKIYLNMLFFNSLKPNFQICSFKGWAVKSNQTQAQSSCHECVLVLFGWLLTHWRSFLLFCHNCHFPNLSCIY